MGGTATGVAAVGEGVCDAECDGIIVRPAQFGYEGTLDRAVHCDQIQDRTSTDTTENTLAL